MSSVHPIPLLLSLLVGLLLGLVAWGVLRAENLQIDGSPMDRQEHLIWGLLLLSGLGLGVFVTYLVLSTRL